MGRGQDDTVFVFDEPTIGLHPLDVRTLLGVFRRLVANGATVIVIEHDLDVIRAADWIVDMGPGGGDEGGRVVFQGPPAGLLRCPDSRTAPYLRKAFP
jgi:excinuclease ABC subunit A